MIFNIIEEILSDFRTTQLAIHFSLSDEHADRDGNGEGRGGDQSLRTHSRYCTYVSVPSLSLLELFERIFILSPNDNKGFPRVSDLRITNTFFIFNFELIILK